LQTSQKKKLPITASSRVSKVSAVGCDITTQSKLECKRGGDNQIVNRFSFDHFIFFVWRDSISEFHVLILVGAILMTGLV